MNSVLLNHHSNKDKSYIVNSLTNPIQLNEPPVTYAELRKWIIEGAGDNSGQKPSFEIITEMKINRSYNDADTNFRKILDVCAQADYGKASFLELTERQKEGILKGIYADDVFTVQNNSNIAKDIKLNSIVVLSNFLEPFGFRRYVGKGAETGLALLQLQGKSQTQLSQTLKDMMSFICRHEGYHLRSADETSADIRAFYLTMRELSQDARRNPSSQRLANFLTILRASCNDRMNVADGKNYLGSKMILEIMNSHPLTIQSNINYYAGLTNAQIDAQIKR